jgi:hypothetical protein
VAERPRDILPLLERQELAFNNYPGPGKDVTFEEQAH